jgi:hypothetical protein
MRFLSRRIRSGEIRDERQRLRPRKRGRNTTHLLMGKSSNKTAALSKILKTWRKSRRLARNDSPIKYHNLERSFKFVAIEFPSRFNRAPEGNRVEQT